MLVSVLREVRVARGFSQEKLGDLLGLTFQQIQKYEKGTNRIAVATLQRIIEVLGVSLDDLLTIDGPEPQTVDTDARQLMRLYAVMSPPMRSRVMRIVELCGVALWNQGIAKPVLLLTTHNDF